MALSRSGIAAVRSSSGEVNKLSQSLKTAGEELKSVLQTNGNYQFFKAGTDKGASVDADLNTAVDAIVDKLVSQISALSGTIEAFCVRQEQENARIEAERRKKLLEQEELAKKGIDFTV